MSTGDGESERLKRGNSRGGYRRSISSSKISIGIEGDVLKVTQGYAKRELEKKREKLSD